MIDGSVQSYAWTFLPATRLEQKKGKKMCACKLHFGGSGPCTCKCDSHVGYRREDAAKRRTPQQYIELDAFNLWVGATFIMPECGPSYPESVWTVEEFEDRPHLEKIIVACRRADDSDICESIPRDIFVYNYCDKIAVIGNVRNAGDPDDNNWGQS